MNAYTFSDVLIEPKYSEITSRSKVDISTTIGKKQFKLPIVSANMKTITGPKMALTMDSFGGMGILHRFNTIDDAVEDFKNTHKTAAVSIGVQEEDKLRFYSLYDAGARLFCIDVAHGHHILVKNMLQWIKSINFANHDNPILIAGNIATADAAYDLIEWGADVLKVGIGPGCFVPGTLITTINGQKPIEAVSLGELVLTHTGEYKEVTTKFEYDRNEEIIEINNDIKCTKNHEIYVISKKDADKVTEDNIQQYAKWIPAGELTKEYMLVEIQ